MLWKSLGKKWCEGVTGVGCSGVQNAPSSALGAKAATRGARKIAPSVYCTNKSCNSRVIHRTTASVKLELLYNNDAWNRLFVGPPGVESKPLNGLYYMYYTNTNA